MRKSFLSIIFSVLILTSLPASAAVYVPFNSIQPIKRITDDGVNTNICTSFSINQAKGYWLTANHCWTEEDTVDGGAQMKWVYWDEDLDVAIFEARSQPSIKLAIKAPAVGDEVMIIGYPHGALDPLVFFGRCASPFARLTQTLFGTIYNLLGLPGDSGGPILDKSGRVVGLGQMSNRSGVVWGTPWRALRDSLQSYWEQ